MPPYYIIIEEWLYPTESGREPVDVTFDTRDEALEFSETLGEKELEAFENQTGVDPLNPQRYVPACGDIGGTIVTAKNGLDPWYYAARVYKIEPLQRTESVE